MTYTITENPIEMKKLTKVNSRMADLQRDSYKKKFRELEMPTERHEDWRYTNIQKFRLENFEPFDGSADITLITLDANYFKEKGIILAELNEAFENYFEIVNKYFLRKKPDDKFLALNASHWNNGLFLYVPKNVYLEIPIRVNFLIKEKSTVIRNLIIIDAGSKIDFVEEYNSECSEECLNSCVTEVYIKPDSKVNYSHLNNWKNANNFTHIVASLERNAVLNWIFGSFSGKINRLRIDTLFNGEGSQSENLGLFVGKNNEHIDITTNAYHNTHHTTNNIKVDGVLKDSSSSVYRGLIRIEKQGQQTNSYLSNHILKIGEKSLGNSIPALQIEANDVKASHGATVGQVSEEHLFYLMSRGLTREQAESMIMQGFLEPIISRIPLEELRERVRAIIVK